LNCFADPSNYLLLCITQSKRGLLLCEHLLDALLLAENPCGLNRAQRHQFKRPHLSAANF
jgi:hypothetical protein